MLVHLHFPGADYVSDQEEFVELARSSGARICAVLGGKRERPDARWYAGSGKVEEIAAAVDADQATLVIFNHELSPSQERNLEQRLRVRVMGRTGLILDIFAQRARSHEGKLQVELAQLRHLSTRLKRGWTHLERQKGGIGLRGGPGETQLEIDRRLVHDKITTLEHQLERVRARRARSRRTRERHRVASVSLVGYTNAGKSTLFNALTGAEGYASAKLFATLDTTVRQFELVPGDSGTLSDTVGFIRNLPTTLVAAFRATLEEVCDAGLLLHVVDAADPERDSRIRQVRDVLEQIGAGDVPALVVFNKIDLLPGEAPRVVSASGGRPLQVFLSAATGAGLELLRRAVADVLRPDMLEREVCLPPRAARLRARLFELRAVHAERVDPDGSMHLRVRLPYGQLVELCTAAGVAPPPPEAVAAV